MGIEGKVDAIPKSKSRKKNQLCNSCVYWLFVVLDVVIITATVRFLGEHRLQSSLLS